MDPSNLGTVVVALMYLLLFLSSLFENNSGLREPRRRGGERRWIPACRKAGLTALRVNRLGLLGRAGQLDVTVAWSSHSISESIGGQAVQGIEITIVGAASPLVALRSEFYRVRKGQDAAVDVQIGDLAFDTRFVVSGSSADALAFLDSGTRSLLMKLDQDGGFDVSTRQVTTFVERETTPGLQVTLTATVDLVQRLTRPLDVPAALAERATRDPAPGVRRNALRALVRGYGDHPGVQPTARAAASDPDVEVRLTAAAALGDEGVDIALAVMDDATTRDVTVASAVAILDRRLPTRRAVEILKDARDRRRLNTARACIERLGKGPAEETLESLVEVLRVDGGELAACAARALGRLGSPAAESPLIAALGRDVPGLRPDAAEALGRVGTVAAVVRLKEAAERYSDEGDFPRIARQAVATIQSRAAGADRGQLTIADDSAGRVSLAERTAGQLSAPDGEAGRLSVPASPVRLR